MLDAGTVDKVARLLRDSGVAKEELHLEILLSGPGGDPHAAFKLASILRARASHVRFWILNWAKSASTLVSLCGDEILMAVEGELGPLDPQMEHMNLEGMGALSALEAVQPVDYFVRMSQKIAFDLGHKIRNEVGLSRRDSMELALRHSEQLLAPILEKFEPSAISQASRQLEVTRAYAGELLRKFHFRHHPPRDQTVEQIAHNLVWWYPDHGFVISRDEARRLGLHVKDAESDPLWPNIAKAYIDAGGALGCEPRLIDGEAFGAKYAP